MRTFRRVGILLFVGLVLAPAFLARPSKPALSRTAAATAPPQTPVAGFVEVAPPPKAETRLPEESILSRFGAAKERRDWAEMRDLRLRCTELPPENIRELIASSDQALLLAELLEEAFPKFDAPLRSAISDAVFLALQQASLDRPDRATLLRLLGLFGGSRGQDSLIVLLQTDPRPEVKRDAALALGETGGESSLPQLQVRAKSDEVAGVYAILAMEGMRKRAAISVSCEVQSEWRERLEWMLEDEAAAAEALGALAFLRETSGIAVLSELIRRPSATESSKKRALRLLGQFGTPEDLEALPVEPSLEADLAAARAEILSRGRSCDGSRQEDE